MLQKWCLEYELATIDICLSSITILEKLGNDTMEALVIY